jgi:ferredoxin-type protein NapG
MIRAAKRDVECEAMPDDRPVNRRRFFQEGLRELLRPLASSLENAARELGAEQAPDKPPRRVSLLPYLRPPGALPEQQFLDTCSRCAACVRVCPARCIRIDSTGSVADGAPYIDADTLACIACDGLYCMPACPTGALQVLPLNQIRMGLAQWHADRCIRGKGGDGEDCQICVERCPIGSFAIETDGAAIRVHDKGCIGCGMCQQHCPTERRAIEVKRIEAG